MVNDSILKTICGISLYGVSRKQIQPAAKAPARSYDTQPQNIRRKAAVELKAQGRRLKASPVSMYAQT